MDVWHSRSIREALRELGSREESGLTAAEARSRLEEYGRNELHKGKRESLPARLLGQLKDPMILVLLGAAGLSLFASGGQDWLDAAIILLIVVVNAVISLTQEDNAHKALEALGRMAAPLARVVRDGKLLRVECAELVPGDVIQLEAGDYVPADGRLLSAIGLKADESAMTGESIPVTKEATEGLPPETPLGDRKNMVIAGTLITTGRGKVLVTATGMESEMGRIAGMLLEQEDGKTPLQEKMGEISRTLSIICLGVCAVMFGVGALQHKDLLEMFMTAVSLAVAAIPEGLPAIVTIVLALGVQRMVKYNAIIKKLPAVETLGCASVICSDKTGTLTQNKMTIVETWPKSDAMRRDILTLGSLCNDAKLTFAGGKAVCTGDPTENAFVDLAFLEGINKIHLDRDMPREGEVPFDSQRKRMSTLHRLPGGRWRLAVKGAPEILLPRCSFLAAQGGKKRAMGKGEARDVSAAAAGMAARALRVLGVAYRDFDHKPSSLSELEGELTFVGLAGMIDPPRPEVKEAVEKCYAAGIRPVMITGDHKDTALAIARDLGIWREGDLAITGENLDFLPQDILEEEIADFAVFARVTPEHKLRIVRAWQKKGKIVAMTGDGVNDAPALKAADIGCAMGLSGTDVAKEAAAMILTDDNFNAVVCAVEQGRGIYANIKKAIHYLLSCNIGEILTIFIATLLGLRPMPLTPVQLLWLNLVTDSLPALALGMEPVEEDVMEKPPRGAGEKIFAGTFAFRLAWQGLMVGGLTLSAYFIGHNMALGGLGDGLANTMAFATLTLSQLFHAFDVRSEEESLLHIGIFSNSAMNKAFFVGMALQLSVLCFPPLQVLFSVTPMGVKPWLVVLGLAMAPLAICEAVKAFHRAQRKKDTGAEHHALSSWMEAQGKRAREKAAR